MSEIKGESTPSSEVAVVATPRLSRKNKERIPKPSWIKMRPPSGEKYLEIKSLLKELKLATVCEEALCPNMAECWKGGTATFMLMGDTCTRGCRFCHIKSSNTPPPVDPDEPEKVGYAISKMGLDYIVLTSVDRDDMEDGGADHFARAVETIKTNDPKVIVEVLTPDFQGNQEHISRLADAKPHVFAQNVETVERLTRKVRDRRAGYWQTLDLLEFVKNRHPDMYTKTSLMLGLGETEEEVFRTLRDLRSVGCDVITFGQYLQPTKKHLDVVEFVTPEKFQWWQEQAEQMGFLYVASGPMVRSSYKAGEYFIKGVIEKNRQEQEERGNA